MKKLFLTLITVLAAGTAAFAQTKGDTEFGISGGLNLATAIGENSYQNAGYRVGFNVGFSFDQYFSDKWSLKVKPTYDQRGWNKGFLNVGSSTYYTSYQLDYVTLPIMANWHFGSTKNWYLNFGPYVSYLLNAKAPGAAGYDVKPVFNEVDGGIDLGVGFKIPVSDKAKFFIELNAQAAVTSLPKSGDTYRSSVSAINVGFNF